MLRERNLVATWKEYQNNRFFKFDQSSIMAFWWIFPTSFLHPQFLKPGGFPLPLMLWSFIRRFLNTSSTTTQGGIFFKTKRAETRWLAFFGLTTQKKTKRCETRWTFGIFGKTYLFLCWQSYLDSRAWSCAANFFCRTQSFDFRMQWNRFMHVQKSCNSCLLSMIRSGQRFNISINVWFRESLNNLVLASHFAEFGLVMFGVVSCFLNLSKKTWVRSGWSLRSKKRQNMLYKLILRQAVLYTNIYCIIDDNYATALNVTIWFTQSHGHVVSQQFAYEENLS